MFKKDPLNVTFNLLVKKNNNNNLIFESFTLKYISKEKYRQEFFWSTLKSHKRLITDQTSF